MYWKSWMNKAKQTGSTTAAAALAFLAFAMAAPAAHAQDARESRLLAPFAECGSISENAERLACFDMALDRLPEIRAAEERRDAQLSADTFGLTQRERQDAGPGPVADAGAEAAYAAGLDRDEEGNFTMTMTIEDVLVNEMRSTVILFDNGQLWRETGNGNLRGLRPGWEATISSSDFGGYRLRVPNRNGFMGVQRVR